MAIGDADVNFSQEVDVLIVGAGISGMLASIDPAAAGKKVLIVEQNSTFGGDAIYSAACQMCTTAELTKEERPDKYSSADQIREKFAPVLRGQRGGPRAHGAPADVGRQVHRQDALRLGLRVPAASREPVPPGVLPQERPVHHEGRVRPHEREGHRGRRVQYLFETTFKTLITDGAGAIAGARFAAKDGSIVDIKAKAVALAAGGYISNQEWMMKYAPEYAFIGNIVGGRKGDGIAAGVAAGGTLSGMGPVSNLNPRYEAGHMLATFYPLIALLPNGKRFYCKTAVHNAATGCLAAGYNEWYSIWDNTAQNGIDQEVIAHAGDAVQTATSFEELAEKTGLHIETVKAAFDNWNTICDNQEDPEFGKTLFLQKLEPPYYFIRNYPVRYKSCGGLAVSDRMEVLDADGNPIPASLRRRMHRRHRGHRPRRRLRPAVRHHPRRRPA